MATGWAGDGAVQDQIDATVKDGIERARRALPKGPSLTRCEECEKPIPLARQKAVPGVRLCVACQEAADRPGDLGCCKDRGRHLIEQRLKQMMVATVDQGDLHRRPFQVANKLKPGETGSDYNNMMRLHFCPRDGPFRLRRTDAGFAFEIGVKAGPRQPFDPQRPPRLSRICDGRGGNMRRGARH